MQAVRGFFALAGFLWGVSQARPFFVSFCFLLYCAYLMHMKKEEHKHHTALYRKYRPAHWDEVLGQEHIVAVLQGALDSGKMAHAYLFCGSRGTGKTTVARIFARELGVSANDIYEIDAASNRGIDDVRELREAVNVLPLESPYKVYIIDEVHMLTKEAFNALLKTLEEPPRHVIFILATTELEKLPETIVSRCQTFTFKKPSHEILKKLVLDTAKKEGFELASSSADLLALLGDGSFRDTHGILQKVLSASSDKNVSEEEIEKIVGAPSARLANDLLSAIAERNTQKGLSSIRVAAEYNVDMNVFIKLILRKLRAVLLLRYAPMMREEMKSDFSEEDFAFLNECAVSAKAINSAVLSEFLSAYQHIGHSYIPQIPLELAIMKLTDDQKSAPDKS